MFLNASSSVSLSFSFTHIAPNQHPPPTPHTHIFWKAIVWKTLILFISLVAHFGSKWRQAFASNRGVWGVQQKLLPERKRGKKWRVCSNDHETQAKWNALWITGSTESSLHFLGLSYRLYIISSGDHNFGSGDAFQRTGEMKSLCFNAVERLAEHMGVRHVSFTVCDFRNHWLEWVMGLWVICALYVNREFKWFPNGSLSLHWSYFSLATVIFFFLICMYSECC